MSSTKRKNPSTSSYISKLQQLRDFVGPSISESELSSTLREYGYNIERAAEALILKASTSAPTTASVTHHVLVKNTSTRDFSGEFVDCIEIIDNDCDGARASETSSLSTSARVGVGVGVKVASNTKFYEEDMKLPAVVKNRPGKKVKYQMGYEGGRLLLCSRWIIGLCTSRRGAIGYKQNLTFSIDERISQNHNKGKHKKVTTPIIRFRSKTSEVDGTLPRTLCVMLAPLLLISHMDMDFSHPLISIEGHSLMEQRNMFIGSEIPICLKVYLERPAELFTLFESLSPQNSNDNENNWTTSIRRVHKSSRAKVHSLLPPKEAAYALFDWAEYGDEYVLAMLDKFAASVENDEDISKGNGENSDEEVEQVLLSEDDFRPETEEEKAPEWTENILGCSSSQRSDKGIPEENDPIALTENGINLHCYQRQALYWMLHREAGASSEETSDELEFLASLVTDTMPNGKRNIASAQISNTNDDTILCECGSVTASKSIILASKTLNGFEYKTHHPLWQRRILASPDLRFVVSFFVNDLLKVASINPPNSPTPCRGGILADAMGLGKTVMILSLLSKSAELQIDYRSQGTGGSLIVTPLSLVHQWADEVESKTNLSCLVYYGERKMGLNPTGVDVVITSYGTIQNAHNSRGLSSLLLSTQWDRVILDEAHIIKNTQTIVSQACCSLMAKKRWCVTGTPIQNSLTDVYGLLKFLQYEPWCESLFWKTAVSSPLSKAHSGAPVENGENKEDQIQVIHTRLKRLLQPIILRRTRHTKKPDGTPILTLPPLETKTIEVALSSPEKAFYAALLTKTQSIFDGFVRTGSATRSFLQIFALLQRLRQACNHPALTVKNRLDSTDMSIKRNLSKPKLDDTPHAMDNSVTHHNNSIEKTEFNSEFLQGLLKKFRGSPQKNSAFVNGVARKIWESIEFSKGISFEEECPVCLECPTFEKAVYTPCMHLFCRECLIPILKDKASKKASKTAASSKVKFPSKIPCYEGECPVCDKFVAFDTLVGFEKSDSGKFQPVLFNKVVRVPSPQKSTDTEDESNNFDDAIAREALQRALSGASSAKLEAVILELDQVWQKDPGAKIVVFSQFLGFLDLLSMALPPIGIGTRRLDGSMKMNERSLVLQNFTKDNVKSQCRNIERTEIERGSVLLMSMKAGGVGLNLVAASAVFLVDPWWNSAFEDQCIHRIHRIGQNAKLVRVRKFVVNDSVEEKIVRLQQRKKEMAKDILNDIEEDDGSFEGQGGKKPTLADFAELFGRA